MNVFQVQLVDSEYETYNWTVYSGILSKNLAHNYYQDLYSTYAQLHLQTIGFYRLTFDGKGNLYTGDERQLDSKGLLIVQQVVYGSEIYQFVIVRGNLQIIRCGYFSYYDVVSKECVLGAVCQKNG